MSLSSSEDISTEWNMVAGFAQPRNLQSASAIRVFGRFPSRRAYADWRTFVRGDRQIRAADANEKCSAYDNHDGGLAEHAACMVVC
jgi:hypothetical protein